MHSEIRPSKQTKLNACLNNHASKNRLLKFFEVLIQINKREKLVKNEKSDNKRNSNNTS